MSQILMYRGATQDVKLTVKRDGVAVDLTGASAEFNVKENASDSSYALQLTGTDPSGDFDWTNKTSGIVVAQIEPGDTSGLTADKYLWNAKITLADGSVYFFPSGSAGLLEFVTPL